MFTDMAGWVGDVGVKMAQAGFRCFGEDCGNDKARGSVILLRALEIKRVYASRSNGFHCRDQADIGTADGTLGAGQHAGGLGSGAAAILLRAIETHAGTAGIMNPFGDGLVARNPFLNGLNHAPFAALGITRGDHLLGHNIITTGFDLAGFLVVHRLGTDAKHRTTRRKSEGNGSQRDNKREVFHDGVDWLVK